MELDLGLPPSMRAEAPADIPHAVDVCLDINVHAAGLAHPHVEATGLEDEPTPMVIRAYCFTCTTDLDSIVEDYPHHRNGEEAVAAYLSGAVRKFTAHCREHHPTVYRLIMAAATTTATSALHAQRVTRRGDESRRERRGFDD